MTTDTDTTDMLRPQSAADTDMGTGEDTSMNADADTDTDTTTTTPPLDIAAVRADFPILKETVNGKPLTWLDSAASAQKPACVIDAVRDCYGHCYANVHRGIYDFSERTTAAYEGARETVRRFLNAREASEIIFTRSATEALNLVAHSFGRGMLKAGDRIIISEMEHHSNIVPWQMLRDAIGVELLIAPVDDTGDFLFDGFMRLLDERVKLVAVTHVSNVLGTITPAAQIVRAAHDVGAKVLFDGAQGAVHLAPDMQELGCDFYVMTGHKLYGPSGIGVLYGRQELLAQMPPFMGGGDMIASVSFEQSRWAEPPARFEAGTPPIAQAIGLGVAIDYIEGIGRQRIAAHEDGLLSQLMARLAAIPGLRLIGTAPHKAAVASFTMQDIHPHDVATILDQQGVAVRAGHHCAEPLMTRMGVPGTVRASLGLYNDHDDIARLAAALEKAREIFA